MISDMPKPLILILSRYLLPDSMAPGILQSLPVSASSSTVNVSYPSNSITPEIRDVELPLNEGLEPIAIIGMGEYYKIIC